ncbi:MAG: hypothetical protein AAFR83_10955 [Cyanobacteria bacterium J06629_18]
MFQSFEKLFRFGNNFDFDNCSDCGIEVIFPDSTTVPIAESKSSSTVEEYFKVLRNCSDWGIISIFDNYSDCGIEVIFPDSTTVPIAEYKSSSTVEEYFKVLRNCSDAGIISIFDNCSAIRIEVIC